MTGGRGVGAGHRLHAAGVAGERLADRDACGEVPDPHRHAGADHGNGTAIELRARHRLHAGMVAGERLADLGVPLRRSQIRTVCS